LYCPLSRSRRNVKPRSFRPAPRAACEQLSCSEGRLANRIDCVIG
jgi:hypothetical protein